MAIKIGKGMFLQVIPKNRQGVLKILNALPIFLHALSATLSSLIRLIGYGGRWVTEATSSVTHLSSNLSLPNHFALRDLRQEVTVGQQNPEKSLMRACAYICARTYKVIKVKVFRNTNCSNKCNQLRAPSGWGFAPGAVESFRYIRVRSCSKYFSCNPV